MTARPGLAKAGQIAALKRAIAEADARAPRPEPVALDAAVVRRVVAEETARLAGFAAEHIREDQCLTDHLGLHELDRIEIALALEERLAMTRPLRCNTWRTVGDVLRDVTGGEQPG